MLAPAAFADGLPMRTETHAATSVAQQEPRPAEPAVFERLEQTNARLQDVVDRLQARTAMQHALAQALAAGGDEQGIAEALHQATGLAVCAEDSFGHLRAWAGPGRPQPYPAPDPSRQEQLLHLLGTHSGALRVKDRVANLMRSRGRILGVLSLVDPARQAGDDAIWALDYAATILGIELRHRLDLVETEQRLRRELVDDLLAGAEESAAYARAAALGHDLRGTHYVLLVQHPHASERALTAAALQAASDLRLKCLHGSSEGAVVLIVDGRPQSECLHRAISERLDSSAAVIGIGSASVTPAGLPESFARARRMLNIRLRCPEPAGASAYDELGFYRLIDAAHGAGAVEDYVAEWLGVLLQYDENKKSTLVQSLSHYLECGGNYDDTAAVLHIHRSTLRYRLTRIAELTGYDLHDVDTRFNLQAATRAWRFLEAAGATEPSPAEGALATGAPQSPPRQ